MPSSRQNASVTDPSRCRKLNNARLRAPASFRRRKRRAVRRKGVVLVLAVCQCRKTTMCAAFMYLYNCLALRRK